MSRTYQDAASRWAGVGPYYAMFPVEFADDVIESYTDYGDLVLDPFAGRGTAVFSAVTKGRSAIGIEINPVGYVYSEAKLNIARQGEVEERIAEIGYFSSSCEEEAQKLPRFFHRCFSERVQRFLLSARANLNWRKGRVDRTVMALLLVYLHGRLGSALSNQMRQTKSMSPQYAIRWWDEHDCVPPDIDPVTFVRDRLPWRYRRGVPQTSPGWMYLGSSIDQLPILRTWVQDCSLRRANLLFTSPPYHAVTNYHYDQWLRLWLLGGPPHALRTGNGRRGKFEAREDYRLLLEQVFKHASEILTDDAVVYVRTDRREFTYQTTLSVLKEVFPTKHLDEIRRPLLRPSQTDLFGSQDTPPEERGDIDLILSPQ